METVFGLSTSDLSVSVFKLCKSVGMYFLKNMMYQIMLFLLYKNFLCDEKDLIQHLYFF